MVKNLIRILKSRNQILEGVKNKLIKKEHIEEIAAERLAICKQCEFYNGECAVPGTGPCCGDCGCSLDFKTRSLSSHCPQDKWFAVVSQKEEDQINDSI